VTQSMRIGGGSKAVGKEKRRNGQATPFTPRRQGE
jgi:hypothetical protein